MADAADSHLTHAPQPPASGALRNENLARPTGGSQTTTVNAAGGPPSSLLARRHGNVGTLTLRGHERRPRVGIRWAEDVVDNEGLGRKKSKVCCIYHKPREVGESSDESSSDSDSSSSDSDSASDQSDDDITSPKMDVRRDFKSPRIVKGSRGARHHPDCNGHRDHQHEHGHDNPPEGNERPRQRPHRRSPNAYEKMPKVRTKGGSGTVTVTQEQK